MVSSMSLIFVEDQSFQPTFTCSKLAIETIVKDMKYAPS